MKQVIVGTYECGYEYVELVLREGTGGEFYTNPEPAHVPRIKIGADYPEFKTILEIVLHEIMEFQIDRHNCRFEVSHDIGRDHHWYMFVVPHHEYSDCIAKTAEFVALCLDDLSEAWNRWKQPTKRKRRTK